MSATQPPKSPIQASASERERESSINDGSNTNNTEPSPLALLLTLPPPLIRLIALSAPLLHTLATVSLCLTWSHPSPFANLLPPVVLILACAVAEPLYRYGLPGAVFAVIVARWMRETRRRRRGLAAKAQTTAAIEDVDDGKGDKSGLFGDPRSYGPGGSLTLRPSDISSAIQSLQTMSIHFPAFFTSLPSPLAPSSTSQPSNILPVLTSYPAYLLLVHFIPPRWIVAAVGTILLTWAAPWAVTIRGALGRSRSLRWAFRVVTSVVLFAGVGLREELPSLRRKDPRGKRLKLPLPGDDSQQLQQRSTPSSTLLQPIGPLRPRELRFLITIYENQRWWIGLDWTAALLPSERPSWSDAASPPQPVLPPASFRLPGPSTSFAPKPKGGVLGIGADREGRVRRTTSWKWVEEDWRIRGVKGGARYGGEEMVKRPTGKEREKSGRSNSVSAIVPSPAKAKTDSKEKRRASDVAAISSATDLATSSDATRAGIRQRLTDSSDRGKTLPSSFSSSLLSSALAIPEAEDEHEHEHEHEHEEVDVDSQGWEYGDNGWNKLSGKSGLGRYTRRRAWIRRAVMVEKDEWISGKEWEAIRKEQEKELGALIRSDSERDAAGR